MIVVSSSKLKISEDVLPVLFVALLTLATLLTLFVTRSLDDNRLTSWQWVFVDADVLKILFILGIGVVLAYVFSGISFSQRKGEALLFISSFAIAAVFWREPEVIVDASRYFAQAKHLELYGISYFVNEWGKNITAWTDLPLIPLLYGLIFRFFGENRIGIQVFTTLLFSGTVMLTYLIGKTLWDRSIGLYAGALLLGMPYLLTQVPLMLVDVPTMFFLTLAIFVTIQATKRGGVGWQAAASGAIALAMLSKYSTWLMLSVLPVIFLCHLKYGWKAILQRTAVIALGAAFLTGVVILWKFDVIAEQLRLLQNYQMPGLKRWGESFTSTFFFQIHPFITIAALYSIYVAFKKRDLKYAIIGWMLLLVMVLEIKRIRYIVLALPMLALMAAYGLREIEDAGIRKFAASTAVVSALVIAVFGFLPFLEKTSAINIKQAGEYLNSIEAQNVEVFALPQSWSVVNPAVSVPILDLFTSKKVVYDYAIGSPSRPEMAERSPLRFTWEYKNPQFFTSGSRYADGNSAVAIILGDRNQSIPDRIARRISSYRLSKEFARLDRVFRYKTIVRVYEPA